MEELRAGVETCNTVKRLALLLAAVIAAGAFAGSASAAGNPFGATGVRFSPRAAPAEREQAVDAAGAVVVTDLSAIGALAVVPRSADFGARIDANRSVTTFFPDTLLAADHGADLRLAGGRPGGFGTGDHDDRVADPWHG